MAGLQVLVLVPGLESALGVEKLDEAHAAFDESAGEQALAAESISGLGVDAVEFFGGL